MPNLRDFKVLVSTVNVDLLDLIESYLVKMDSGDSGKELLMILGAIQACLQELYKSGIGDKETAMLYYGVADRIIASMVDRGKEDAQS